MMRKRMVGAALWAVYTAVMAVLIAASCYAPGMSTPSPTMRVKEAYFVNTHSEWWHNPYYRVTDSPDYPKFVIVSDNMDWACVMTRGDEKHAEWASVLPREDFACPNRWRAPRK